MSNTVINTNVLSINAQRNLSKSAGQFAQSLERLSSGLRINGAKDDAAGLAIATRFSAQINGSLQAMRNTNDGLSITQTAEGSMNTIMDNLQTMRQLAVQSASDGNSALDRQALNNDLNALLSEVKRIAATAEFNGQRLLDGTTFGQVFQIGANQGQTIAVNGVDARATQIGATRVVGSEGLSADNIKAGFEVKGKMEIGLSQSRGVGLNENLLLEIDLDKLGGFNDAAKYNSVEIGNLTSAAINSIGSIAGTQNNWGGVDLTINGAKFDVNQAFTDVAGYNNWADITTGTQLADFLNQAVLAQPATYGVEGQWDSATNTWSGEHVQFATWEPSGNSGKLVLQTEATVSMVTGDNGVLLNTTDGQRDSVGTVTQSLVQFSLSGSNSTTYTEFTIAPGAMTFDGSEGDITLSYEDRAGNSQTFTVLQGNQGGAWTVNDFVNHLNSDTAQNQNGRFEFSVTGLSEIRVRDNQGAGVNATPAFNLTDTTTTVTTGTVTATETRISDVSATATFAAGTFHQLKLTIGGETRTIDVQKAESIADIQTALQDVTGFNRGNVYATLDGTDLVISDGDGTADDGGGARITGVSLTGPYADAAANKLDIRLTANELKSITHLDINVGVGYDTIKIGGVTQTNKNVFDTLATLETGADIANYLNTLTFEHAADPDRKLEASWDQGTQTMTIQAYEVASAGNPDRYVLLQGDIFQAGSKVGTEETTQAGTRVNSLEDLTRVINSAIDAAVKGTEPEGVGLKTADGSAVTAAQRQEFGLANLKAGIVTLQGGNSTITITGAFDAKFDLDMTDFRAEVNDQAQTKVSFFGSEGEILASKQVNLTEITVATREDASLAISVIDGALAMVSDKRSEIGAVQRKFESALENLGIARQNMEASRSRIVDTDFAVETANLTKAQILQQAGISVLAQANASSQSVLSLLQ